MLPGLIQTNCSNEETQTPAFPVPTHGIYYTMASLWVEVKHRNLFRFSQTTRRLVQRVTSFSGKTNNLWGIRLGECRKVCRQLSVKRVSTLTMGTVNCPPCQTQTTLLFLWNATRWIIFLGCGPAENMFRKAYYRSPCAGFLFAFFFSFGKCMFYTLTFMKVRIHVRGIPKSAMLSETCTGKCPPWRLTINNIHGFGQWSWAV